MLARCASTPEPIHAPTTVVTPRAATPVNASFERTWAAVIDQLADQNLSIRVLDKSSGWVATQMLSVSNPWKWADCGATGGDTVQLADPPSRATVTEVHHIPVERAEYDVVVHGDTAHATVRVSVHWIGVYRAGTVAPPVQVDCVTHGLWEAGFEGTVKRAAEQR
jgi:hypothetical protein